MIQAGINIYYITLKYSKYEIQKNHRKHLENYDNLCGFEHHYPFDCTFVLTKKSAAKLKTPLSRRFLVF